MTTEEGAVLTYAQGKLNATVTTGECWDLAEAALKSAGAKTSNDLQKVTANMDYVWGTMISSSDAGPGDIAQLLNFKVRIDSVTTDDKGESSTFEEMIFAANHTAIVEKKMLGGKQMTVLQQNYDSVRSVKRKDIYFTNYTNTVKNGERSTTITVEVSGSVKFYRPISIK